MAKPTAWRVLGLRKHAQAKPEWSGLKQSRHLSRLLLLAVQVLKNRLND